MPGPERLLPAAMLVIGCVLAWQAAAQAPDPADTQADTLHLEAMVEGVNPATGREGGAYAVRAWLGAERTRVELEVAGAPDAYLLVDNQTGSGWAIATDREAALPVQTDAYRMLVVDPAAPCARMQARCQAIGQRNIAGVRAQGMRYTNAGDAGPGGSDRGQVWVDPATGLILAYDGQTRGRSVRRMRATRVEHAPVSDDLFVLPAALGGP